MEFKQIKELMSQMGRNGTKRVRIKKKDFEIELEREDERAAFRLEQAADIIDNPMSKDIAHHLEVSSPSRLDKSKEAEKVKDTDELKGQYVASPMVGTFYDSASPQDPSFVQPGDKVSPDTVVCIIEAMKVMNEVKAGIEGTVAEVMMDKGHPVEFGTKLFRIV